MVETLMDFVRTQGNREKLDGGLGDLATGYKEAESIEDLWYRMRKYGETSPYPVWRKVFSLSNPTTLIDTNGRFYHQLSPKTDLTVDGEPTTPCRSSFVSSINIHDDIEEQSSTSTIEKAEAFDVFSPRVYQRERGEKLGYDTEQLGRFYESSSSAATPRWGYPRSVIS
ncbi:hypothetical protein HZH66_002686 [Vespula vulgaris]|uniref:Uncharacterized protein n=1 Tax=Vespula vulgaris TaxID=7454 RepID=A0A834KNK6_VESVU|nr:hypothetical protein HZH66_002686 [Vespula vulgaris]